MQVTCSHYTTESGCAPVTAFIGRVGARVLTSTPPSGVRPWYQVDLMGRTFTPNAYTLRHYSSYDSAGLRNWALEGWSESASKWVVIRRHTEDRSLARASQAVTWRLMEDGASYCNPFDVVQNAPFSKFRILSTGMQDSTEIMICSGFEVRTAVLVSSLRSAKQQFRVLVVRLSRSTARCTRKARVVVSRPVRQANRTERWSTSMSVGPTASVTCSWQIAPTPG